MRYTSENCAVIDTSLLFARLIERIRGGDEVALQKLLTAVAGPLRGMADRLIGSSLRRHLDAEDLVQAVSLILWRGLQDGKFEVAGPQQLLGLARTLLKREVSRTVKRLKSTLALAPTFEGDLGATLVDRPVVHVYYVAEKAERDDQIRHLMERVSDRDRQMLELLLLGNSIAETARILGLDPAALRMRLSRLRVRLRSVQCVDKPQG